MSQLRGAKELRARLRALKKAFKPVGREWAVATVEELKPDIPTQTGKTRRSIRKGRVTEKRATVVSDRAYIIRWLDKGTKAHSIEPKRASVLRFDRGGQTVFARKATVRGVSGRRGLRREAAERGLERVDVMDRIVDLWNEAA